MIKVTVEDTESGEVETMTIENDYVLVTAGSRYLYHTQEFPTTGSTILTIKTQKPEEGEKE